MLRRRGSSPSIHPLSEPRLGVLPQVVQEALAELTALSLQFSDFCGRAAHSTAILTVSAPKASTSSSGSTTLPRACSSCAVADHHLVISTRERLAVGEEASGPMSRSAFVVSAGRA